MSPLTPALVFCLPHLSSRPFYLNTGLSLDSDLTTYGIILIAGFNVAEMDSATFNATLTTLRVLNLEADFLESLQEAAEARTLPGEDSCNTSCSPGTEGDGQALQQPGENLVSASRRQQLAAESRKGKVAWRPHNTSKSCSSSKQVYEAWCHKTGRSSVLTNETSVEYAR